MQLLVAPLEEELDIGDPPRVLLALRFAGAGRQALVEVVVEAGALLAVEREMAVRDLEETRDHPQRAASVTRGQEGAEVAVTVLARAAHEQDPRERVADRELEVREVLVVAQEHVVARLVLLDQVVLEDQRFDLARGDDHVERSDLLDERRDTRRVLRRGLEVGAHAGAQRLCLADVDHGPRAVAVAIAARPRRQTLELSAQCLGQVVAHATPRRSPPPSPAPAAPPRGRGSRRRARTRARTPP